MSEGIDFSDNNARAVIGNLLDFFTNCAVVGVPFPQVYVNASPVLIEKARTWVLF